MPNYPTIAEVLHYAADHQLEPCMDYNYHTHRKAEYSCDAVYRAVCHLLPDESFYVQDAFDKKIKKGLTRLGLKTDSCYQYKNITKGAKRQGARYAWLKFAALLAEEQGV